MVLLIYWLKSGNKYKSIHLLDPLTSIPINGTKIKNIKEMQKLSKKS